MFHFSLVVLHVSLFLHILMTSKALDFTCDTNIFILRRENSNNLMYLPKGRFVVLKTCLLFPNYRTWSNKKKKKKSFSPKKPSQSTLHQRC